MSRKSVMKKRSPLGCIACFLGLIGGALVAEDDPSLSIKDPYDCLGMTLADAYASIGPPIETFVYREEGVGESNVVFFYQDFSYLFWYKSRVWEIRWDHRYGGEILGMVMGTSREEVLRQKGKALHEDEDSLVYDLPPKGYPIRLRLFFDEKDKLNDVYLYRGDY